MSLVPINIHSISFILLIYKGEVYQMNHLQGGRPVTKHSTLSPAWRLPTPERDCLMIKFIENEVPMPASYVLMCTNDDFIRTMIWVKTLWVKVDNEVFGHDDLVFIFGFLWWSSRQQRNIEQQCTSGQHELVTQRRENTKPPSPFTIRSNKTLNTQRGAISGIRLSFTRLKWSGWVLGR